MYEKIISVNSNQYEYINNVIYGEGYRLPKDLTNEELARYISFLGNTIEPDIEIQELVSRAGMLNEYWDAEDEGAAINVILESAKKLNVKEYFNRTPEQIIKDEMEKGGAL